MPTRDKRCAVTGANLQASQRITAGVFSANGRKRGTTKSTSPSPLHGTLNLRPGTLRYPPKHNCRCHTFFFLADASTSRLPAAAFAVPAPSAALALALALLLDTGNNLPNGTIQQSTSASRRHMSERTLQLSPPGAGERLGFASLSGII